MCGAGGWLARHGGALLAARGTRSQWGLAYQQPTRARVSRVYVLVVGQSRYSCTAPSPTSLPSVRDRVFVSDLWYLVTLAD